MDRLRHLIGLLVLVAAGVGGWWLVRMAGGVDTTDGYRLTVELGEAHGLRTGAQVRHRGVEVGQVRDVRLAEDSPRVHVTVWLEPVARRFASVNSSFWVVAPRFQGLTEGVTGLDTLIRDAYLAFATPRSPGPLLETGSLVQGSEGPPQSLDDSRLPDVQVGDLTMELVVPENFGLQAGSPVRFRGIDTGEVRHLELAADGSHVLVSLRIERAHRRTVTDRCSFWVARPNVGVGFLDGIRLAEVAALLEPYVAYHGASGEGLPVQDGWRVRGLAERPDLDVEPVPAAALNRPEAPAGAAGLQVDSGPSLVHVAYQGVETDWLSPDDDVSLSGTGLIYVDRDDRVMVLTARSACDGGWMVQDGFGEPEMTSEQIRVLMADGTVLRAARRWVNPVGSDVALLEILDAPPALKGLSAVVLRSEMDLEAPGPWAAHCAGPDGLPRKPLDGFRNLGSVMGEAQAPPHPVRGALVVGQGGAVVAVLGGRSQQGPLTLQGLAGIPDAFLPRAEAEATPTAEPR